MKMRMWGFSKIGLISIFVFVVMIAAHEFLFVPNYVCPEPISPLLTFFEAILEIPFDDPPPDSTSSYNWCWGVTFVFYLGLAVLSFVLVRAVAAAIPSKRKDLS